MKKVLFMTVIVMFFSVFTAVAEQPEPAFTETARYPITMPQNNDETDIYYPVPDANDSASYTFPVALFLQGGRVNKSYFAKFAHKLAAYGFIVVVPNHYADFILTHPDYPGIEIYFDGFFPENQQIPDVLDFMSDENDNAVSPLFGIVNKDIMVLTGHSFGSAVILDAIQETCEFPLCRPEGSIFTLPEEVKAVALTGINTLPFGNPFDDVNRSTDNPVPMAIINGDLDENAEYHDTKDSYNLIENLPKSLVFVKGANHYGLCDENNPGNPNYPEEPKIDGTPTPQKSSPTLDQDISIETNARWAALFLRAHALNDSAALEYISTTGSILDPNVEVRYGDKLLDYEAALAQAFEIDDNICDYTQTLFGDIDETSGVTVAAVNPGSAFTSTKATVDGSTNTAIPVYMIVQGTSDEIFRNDKINTMIWCKTRIPEAIEWNTGIEYTDQETAAGTCRQVNEEIYNMTLDLLTDEQRNRYIDEGKPIVFTDETIVGQGIDFYALDQYSLIHDNGTHLEISPASLESDFIDPSDDRHGAKYCKIISSQNLLAWMQDGAFNNGASLTPSDSTKITCEDMANSVGSCYFINEHTSSYMCEDYIGPVYTGGDSGTAKAKCIDKRAGTYVDGVACVDRTDTSGLIAGICAINESIDGAYTWSLYYPEGEDECPLRFFTCSNECINEDDCSDGYVCSNGQCMEKSDELPGLIDGLQTYLSTLEEGDKAYKLLLKAKEAVEAYLVASGSRDKKALKNLGKATKYIEKAGESIPSEISIDGIAAILSVLENNADDISFEIDSLYGSLDETAAAKLLKKHDAANLALSAYYDAKDTGSMTASKRTKLILKAIKQYTKALALGLKLSG